MNKLLVFTLFVLMVMFSTAAKAGQEYRVKQAGAIAIDLPPQASYGAFLIIFQRNFQPIAHNRVLVTVDVEQKPGNYPITVVENLRPRPFGTLVVESGQFPPPVILPAVRFNPRLQSRHDGEEKAIRVALSSGLAYYGNQHLGSAFGLPLDRIEKTDDIGTLRKRKIVYPDKHSEWSIWPHGGVDLKANGEKVYAINDGYVALVGRSYLAEGNILIIYHGDGIYSIYMHLAKEPALEQGDKVSKGDVIAISGNTGQSFGPHLHFAITAFGARVDPISFIQLYNSLLD